MKPVVVEFQNVTGIMGREASLVCKASGDPLPEVTFVKEGTLIPFSLGIQNYDDRIIVDTRREGEFAQSRLTIRDLMRSDDGLYACVAKNAGIITLDGKKKTYRQKCQFGIPFCCLQRPKIHAGIAVLAPQFFFRANARRCPPRIAPYNNCAMT